jgi:phosphoribosylformimino-5-aminoimidazole carboxamide ribotide isomerase
MLIIPAIDLKGGKCVRLRQGRADDAVVYSGDPVAMARRWVEEGAKYLHVVDLDGAFQGRPAHTEVIGQIVRAIDIPVEVGGGLRTDEDVRALLAVGVDRAIVGTRAWAEPETLQRLAGQFGRQLAVGIDARDGRVQVKGWVETTEQLATDLARKAEAMGVECIIYTDTSKDGMMAGTNVRAMDEMCGAVTCSVIASGGVTSRTDAEALRGLKRRNLVGAIVGKALYEGRVTLKELEA